MDSERRQELLFRAIGGVGGDLVDGAERKTFPLGFWRKWTPVAACLVLLTGLALWAGPWFLPGPAAPAEPQPPAQTAEPPMTEKPPEEQAKPEQPVEQEPLQPKVRLIVFETEYYVEAYYPPDRVEPGPKLGVVASSDGAVLDGAAVYQAGEAKKENKAGQQIPLEIFVEYDGGYLYCISYFAWDGPLYTAEEIRELWQIGKWDTLLQVFGGGPVFDDPAALTAEELRDFFLQTLRMEEAAGRRSRDLSRYLWEDGDRYLIPLEDVTDQLDRYLAGYVFTPRGQPWYDEAYEALVLDSLEPPETLQLRPVNTTAFEGDTLTLVADCCSDDGRTVLERRTYTIRFTQNGCIYESITAQAAPQH